MKINTIAIQLYILAMFVTGVSAQEIQNFKRHGVEIQFHNEDPSIDKAIVKKFVSTIFKTYPKLMKRFNKNARTDLKVKIDTSYNGVAYAQNGAITISSKWIHQHPTDIDLITHEGMHIIQAYPNGSGPGWLTEGIADYVRHVYGVDNQRANWYLTQYKDGQHYTNSYRITANFLVWTTANFDKELVKKLDYHLREKTYTPGLWKKYTGKTLDQLWKLYEVNPSMS
ncbi:basic secretory family protein [Arenibacter sp. ARW7G5Y1]|uniref:basic secretory family protein n=1 Tax=Arenibacter sp. ARW7G5Y1 TaxID=2135619 RepID=UPI000D8FD148|nr:basic secretory family protein [Arenibacter sp. ARW7G5Y1]PXX29045.1 basic secretory peptidase family protein [Arenibacter sp. ARW7G5Y1]